MKARAERLTVAEEKSIATRIRNAAAGAVPPKTHDDNCNWGRRHDDNKIRVGLIDEHRLTRESLSCLLSTEGREFVFSCCSDVAELREVHADAYDQLRLVLFHIGSTKASDGRVKEDIEQLHVAFADTPVVLLSDCEDVSCISQALRFGVRGYIPTRLDPSVVIEALRLVQVGGTFLPPDLLVKAFDSAPQSVDERQRMKSVGPDALACLTPRQAEVVDRLRQGMSNKLIAHELQMQESTVKVHVRHIMKKLGATNRTQAALLASRVGAEQGPQK